MFPSFFLILYRLNHAKHNFLSYVLSGNKKNKKQNKKPTLNETCDGETKSYKIIINFIFPVLLMKTKQDSLHLISSYAVSE